MKHLRAPINFCYLTAFLIGLNTGIGYFSVLDWNHYLYWFCFLLGLIEAVIFSLIWSYMHASRQKMLLVYLKLEDYRHLAGQAKTRKDLEVIKASLVLVRYDGCYTSGHFKELELVYSYIAGKINGMETLPLRLASGAIYVSGLNCLVFISRDSAEDNFKGTSVATNTFMGYFSEDGKRIGGIESENLKEIV